MIIRIEKLLDDDQLAELDTVFAGLPWKDGAIGMRDDIQAIKNNQQVDRDAAGEALAVVDGVILDALSTAPQVLNGVFPHRIMRPLYAKYGEGQNYGLHTDNPFIGNPESIRADVSCTVFLNDPDDYEGGELMIATPAGEGRIKLPKGAAVLYPTGWHHQVNEITGGERRVAVTWVQSRVAENERRDILADANGVAHHLHQTAPNSAASLTAQRVFNNLMRRWAGGT